jgi:hypothetical protein
VLRTAPGCKQGLTPAPTSLSTPSPRRCLLKKSLRPGSLCGTRPGDHPARGVRRLSAPAARGDTALPSSREPLRADEGSVGGSIRGFLRLLARDGRGGGGSVSDCGIFENGFARLHCGGCRRDVLVAFSCKGRGLCPSCGAKRGAATAARLREEVLEAVGHAQWVSPSRRCCGRTSFVTVSC